MTLHEDLRIEVRNAITDLSQAAREQELLALCLAAVQTVDEGRLRAAAATAAPLRPQMLLTLLAYCYVKGTYDSRDIVGAVAGDRTLRYICAGVRPLWTDLRRFRRHHRELVAQCLAWVLAQVSASKPCEAVECFHGCEWSSTGLSGLIAGEVATRLGAAALMDGADSD